MAPRSGMDEMLAAVEALTEGTVELPVQGGQLLSGPSRRCCRPSLSPSVPMPRPRPESESPSHLPRGLVATQDMASEEWTARNPEEQEVQGW